MPARTRSALRTTPLLRPANPAMTCSAVLFCGRISTTRQDSSKVRPREAASMDGMPTKDAIRKALESVIDPELRRNIVELDMVRSIEIKDGGVVDVMVSLTTPGCPI